MKLLAIPFLSTAVVLICSCADQSKKIAAGTEEKKSIPVITVQKKDTFLALQYVADIQAKKNVEIHSRIEGVLDKIFVEEGQRVHKGQLLFKIDDSELQLELRKAKAARNSSLAEAKVAQVEVERVQLLVEKNIVSQTELELAKAKYNAWTAKAEQAEAEQYAASRRLTYTQMHSPFDGIIDRLPLKEGSLLSTGSLLTTISDISMVNAYFKLSENEYFQLLQTSEDNSDRVVNLVLPDGTLYPHSGKITAAESEIDEQTGSIAFKVAFQNPEKMLKHGGSGKLLISKTIRNALLVPQKSVYEIQDKNYVFIVGPNNVVKMQSITPTHRLASYYVVTSGLKGNEKIVYEGIQSLKEGDQIVPEYRNQF